MASHDPSKYKFSTSTTIALYTTLLTVYYMYAVAPYFLAHSADGRGSRSFDTSMSQKSRFKMQTQGIYKYRWTFPQLPWGTVENPEYIQTAHGCVPLSSLYSLEITRVAATGS